MDYYPAISCFLCTLFTIPGAKKLFGNSQSTAVAPELRPCVTTGAKIASCSSLQSLFLPPSRLAGPQ
ncbi:MAG: hypothetical protein BECKG1743D_GA0114223_111622, partial [Candidatus Kentron sp. G]